jgi:hypothetical protein
MRRSKTAHITSNDHSEFLIPIEEDLYIRDALSLYNLSDKQLNQVFQGLYEVEMRQKYYIGKKKFDRNIINKGQFPEKEAIKPEKKKKLKSKILFFLLFLVLLAIIFRTIHIHSNNIRYCFNRIFYPKGFLLIYFLKAVLRVSKI